MSAPPSDKPDEKTWFVSLNGKRYGPFTFAALIEAAAKGLIVAETDVWRLGWVKWHPARRVPGLIDAPAIEPHAGPLQTEERPVAAEALSAGRPVGPPVPVMVPGPTTPPVPAAAPVPIAIPVAAAPPEIVVVRPAQQVERSDAATMVPEVLPPSRDDPVRLASAARSARRFGPRAAVMSIALLLAVGAGWGAFKAGLIDPDRLLRLAREFKPGAGGPKMAAPKMAAPEATPPNAAEAAVARPEEAVAEASGDRGLPLDAAGLPDLIAVLPAVVTLERSDPAGFDRFRRGFLASYAAGGPRDEALSLARAMLRKSLKRQLAASPGESLIEITRVYLGYMQGLQASDPGSCVALSDEGKGAKLTSNLARAFPDLFARDMAVLARAASGDGNGPSPLTAEQIRPYLASVFARLRQQSLPLDLLSRDQLAAAEYQPYCGLVIAFYQAALAQPQEVAINVLRYLYASAAADPDDQATK